MKKDCPHKMCLALRVCVCVCNMLSFMTMFLFDQYLKPGSRHRQTITPTSKEMSKASGPESA